jgi:hypothetical protein
MTPDSVVHQNLNPDLNVEDHSNCQELVDETIEKITRLKAVFARWSSYQF